MSELPEGWVNVLLSDIARWGSGGTPSRANSAYYSGSIPWVKTGELGQGSIENTEEKITELGLQNSSAKIYPTGSVLIAMYGATTGKTAILGIDAATNQACAVGIPIENITTTKYLFYYLSSQRDAFVDAGKGGAQPNISLEVIKNWTIPLAPFKQQKRIVDKLDSLLAQVNACRDRLDRISHILKRFRQSVLSAATSGQLADENWLQNEDDETTIFCLSQVIEQLKTGPFGSALHRSDYVLNGIPVINPMHINDGSITPTSEVTVSEEKAEQLQEYLLKEGDIILARRGVMGRCAVVGIKEQGWLCGSGSMIVRTTNRILPKYLQIVLSGHDIVKVLEANAVGSTMVNLNQKILLNLEIPVPSIAIQELITRQVKLLFSYADRLEDSYKKACLQVEQLTPTLLNMAFRGELMPQDPDDEPASALLERIQIAKAAQPLEPRVSNTRRSTMTKLSHESVKKIINQLPNDKFSFEELHRKISGDYDLLKDIFFTLLDETDPIIEQIFDREAEAMCFLRGSK